MNPALRPDLVSYFRGIVADVLVISSEDVDLDAKLTDLGADSLDLIEIVRIFEDDNDVRVDDNELGDLKTLADAFTLLSGKIDAPVGDS